MNEQIKKLADQAGFFVGENSLSTARVEKFAELIVRECFDCIAIMEKIANSSNASIPNFYDKYTYRNTLSDLKGLLNVHFGVEE
jgi:hypothetical protein